MQRTFLLPSILFCLLISCLPCTAPAQIKQGQERLDSLLNEAQKKHSDTGSIRLMNKISTAYCYINPNEGLAWATKALALAKKMQWRRAESYAYNDFGMNYTQLGAFPDALNAYFRTLRIAEEQGEQEEEAGALINIGSVYGAISDSTKALKYFLKGLRIAEKGGYKQRIYAALTNISITLVNARRYSDAMEYLQRALPLAVEMNDQMSVGTLNSEISIIYNYLGRYPEALAYAFNALRIVEKLGNRQMTGAYIGNIGQTYFRISQDSTVMKPDSLVPRSKAEALAKAIEYLKKGIAVSRQMQLWRAVPDLSNDLSEAFVQQGDYKSALGAYKEAVETRDSLYNIANNEKVANLETQRAVELKNKDIQIARLAVAKKRNERAFYIAGIALLLVIMGILLFNFRRNKSSQQRIKALQDHKISLLDEAVKRRTEQLGSMRQTIATDFHDQTGNMLAAITRQAGTLELKLLSQPEVLPMVRSIIANSNELYASSKDFLWNLNHDSDDPLVLFQYLSGYGQRFYNQFDIAFSSEIIGEEQPHLQLQPFAGLNLIYIFKEAMSNIIKHSGADEVRMELRWEERQVVYALQDNGLWKEADANTEHYGLGNMERRSRQSGFGYQLTHGAAGTRVAISLPVSADFVKTMDAPTD